MCRRGVRVVGLAAFRAGNPGWLTGSSAGVMARFGLVQAVVRVQWH